MVLGKTVDKSAQHLVQKGTQGQKFCQQQSSNKHQSNLIATDTMAGTQVQQNNTSNNANSYTLAEREQLHTFKFGAQNAEYQNYTDSDFYNDCALYKKTFAHASSKRRFSHMVDVLHQDSTQKKGE